IFEYRNKDTDIKYSERVNYRGPLINILDKILIKIKLRNTVFQFQTGLIRRDILSFNEEVVREALLNAVIHRDYKKHSSVFIKQSPEKIVFKSPGGLPFGITPENIHKKNFWRNRRLAESFEKIGFVERSGQGVDLIFENTIREGKGIPDYFDSDESEVVLNIPAIVKNKEFVSYLDEVDKKMQIGFSVDDLILLETIKSGKKNNIIKKDVQKFLDKGVVVVIGHGRGTKYLLSKEYYKSKDILGEYTKLEGLGRDRIKEMIVKHIKDNGSIISVEVRQAFPELTSKDINNILQELRRSGKLLFRGNPQTGKWFLNG
ncbi:transcriptional regulator, partial [Patescibacteria group bacterium]|nr:transcriptional regulator [Patescibacteria group bacterium]